MPYIRATHTAAGIGKILAILMGFFGFFYNIMLSLIAFFIYIGASEEEKSTEVTVILEGVKVRDIMSRENRKNVKVSKIMSFKELITASEDDDAVAILKLLTRNGIGRILIKKDDKMIGIVSRTDVLRAVQLLE